MQLRRILSSGRAPLLALAMSAWADSELCAQAAGEYTLASGTETINTAKAVSGDGYTIPVDDLAYESTAHRNAFVVQGQLTLASGAAVSVANSKDLTAFMRVGYGSNGSMLIQDNATVAVGSPTRYANLQIGQGKGVTGTVTQTGGQLTVIGSFNVGVNGGTGIYTISGPNGKLTFDHAGPTAANRTSLISIGMNNATQEAGETTGTINIEDGLVEALPTRDGGVIGIIIGNRAYDALAAYKDKSVTTDAVGTGHGTVNQTGGTFRIGAGAQLFLSGQGNGTYNLNGGSLEIGGSSLQPRYGGSTTSTHAFNLGGGTIKVIGSSLVTSVNATLIAGSTSKIDTNALGASFSGSFSGSGALKKTGAGTLALTGSSSFSGTTTVSTGTLRVDGSLTESPVIIKSGATFAGHGSVAALTIESGGRMELGGTPGPLTITGDLSLLGSSYILLNLASATRYDRLQVNGSLTAAGTLAIALTEDYHPASGASFTLFNRAVSGTFDAVQLPSLSAGLEWNTDSLYSSGVLSVATSAIPEPAVGSSLAGTAVLLLALVRSWRRRSARSRPETDPTPTA